MCNTWVPQRSERTRRGVGSRAGLSEGFGPCTITCAISGHRFIAISVPLAARRLVRIVVVHVLRRWTMSFVRGVKAATSFPTDHRMVVAVAWGRI